MAILPRPRTSPASIATAVAAAAGNVAHSLLYGGLADLRPMPRTLIDDGTRRELYHYRPAAGATPEGDPVLLVTPLAAPAICYDLRRGCSLVEHLVETNRPTYLVEYGEVNFSDRSLGIEHWISHVVPEAIRSASEHAGGRPVHVAGWSLGGIFTMLTAADAPGLPIASLTVLGSPCDVRQVPLIAPLRPLLNLPPGNLVTTAYQAFGGAPKPLVRWAFQLSSVNKMITKPVAKLSNLADREFLAQLEAVDRFGANMIAYPGRTFGQLYHHFFRTNALFSGKIGLGDHTVHLSDVKHPTLVIAGANDGIGPVAAVKPLVDLLTGAGELRFEVVPGGHLGLLTGRAARTTTWPLLDEWFTQHDS